MSNRLAETGLISLKDLTKDDILTIIKHAKQFKQGLRKNSLKGKVLASCFFEASTRTRLSFESAIMHLDGKVIGFSESGSTSQAKKGESLVDTLRMIDGYADGLIIRHPNDGVARLASEIINIPVVNAGDGANEHPSQTLLDLFTINDCQDKLEGISLGLMGDLRYSRTIHSLIDASKLFNMRLFLIAPDSLRMSHDDLMELKRHGISYSFHQDLTEVIDQLDCLYLTRLQKERMLDDVVCDYGINLDMLNNAKPNLKILHPLPRLAELPVEIDETPYAYYFQQAQNGLYVRQAILDMMFDGR